MKKKIFRFITHPILHIVVSVAALWFGANAWLAGGFALGLAIGLTWGIKRNLDTDKTALRAISKKSVTSCGANREAQAGAKEEDG